jgi:hypothetical protein
MMGVPRGARVIRSARDGAGRPVTRFQSATLGVSGNVANGALDVAIRSLFAPTGHAILPALFAPHTSRRFAMSRYSLAGRNGWAGLLLLAAATGCSNDQPALTAVDPPISNTTAIITVTPPTPVTVLRNSTHSSIFQVSNTGGATATLNMSCTGRFVTCLGFEDGPSSIVLSPGTSKNVVLEWKAGNTATTIASLTLNANPSGPSGTQRITIQ